MDAPRPDAATDDPPELILKVEPSATISRLPLRQRLRKRLIPISIILLCVGGLVGGLCAVGLQIKREVLRNECASNLKNIAAACINYSQSHNGKYPASMAELFSTSGMSPYVLVCPASTDEAAAGTPAEIAAKIAIGESVSYIYIGNGVTLQDSATAVVAYDRPGNHGDGINVLFNDFRVGWIDKKDVPGFLKTAESGVRPVYWP